MKKFQALYNEDANKIVKQVSFIDFTTIVMVAEDTKSIEDEPKTFKEALNHAKLESLRKWKEAI